MATATSFPEANDVLKCPEEMENCYDLEIHRGQDQQGVPLVISCWEFSEEELAEIMRTKKAFVCAWGITAPPIYITGISPFPKQQAKIITLDNGQV